MSTADAPGDVIAEEFWDKRYYGLDCFSEYRETADGAIAELHRTWRGIVANWHLEGRVDPQASVPWPCECDDNNTDDMMCDESKAHADRVLREWLFAGVSR